MVEPFLENLEKTTRPIFALFDYVLESHYLFIHELAGSLAGLACNALPVEQN